MKCRKCGEDMFVETQEAEDIYNGFCYTCWWKSMKEKEEQAKREGKCRRCYIKPAVDRFGFCEECHEWFAKTIGIVKPEE